MKNPRILILRVGAMGDVLHALPAVAALRAALPGAHIGWAIDPRWAPLLESPTGDRPLVDTLHLVHTRSWTPANFLPQIRNLRLALRAQHYTHAIDLQGSIRSAVIARLSAAPHITGPATPRETPARIFYTRRVPLLQANVIDQAAELINAALQHSPPASPLNVPHPDPQRREGQEPLPFASFSNDHLSLTPTQPTLPTDPEAESWATPYGSHPFILIVPTAGWGAKEWPLAHYAALIPLLEARGYRVLLNATPTSSPNLEAEAVPSTLPQLIALTRRATLVIGGDTGPIHLAAALGRPALALFGPTDPARNGPAFPHSRAKTLRHSSSRTDHHRTSTPDSGLKQITVEEVFNAALELLESKPGE